MLELADRRLEEAISGRGHCLLLAGDVGIRKTRLLAATRLGRQPQRAQAMTPGEGRWNLLEWSGRED